MSLPSLPSLPRLPLLPLLLPLLLLLLLLPLATPDDSHRCNGHGTYKNNGRCECWALNSRQNTYWLGATCTMKQCPQGKTWADIATATDTAHALGVECSGQGTCDRNTGTCVCEEGFEGIACSRMTCPNGCSGHGTCKSMRRNARDNPRSWTTEKLMQYYYTAVWDAEMIYGCHCDREFHGYDCSLRICPDGDDPLTTGQVNEKQAITCQGFDSFQIGYDNFLSRPIEATGTTADVRRAIMELPTVRNVVVTFTCLGGCTDPQKLQACVGSGGGSLTQTITIEFLENFGDLTLVNAYSLRAQNKMTVTEAVKGTKEGEVCAGRGNCDDLTGMCSCMAHFFSSDGYAGPGDRGDCGYMMVPDQPLTAMLGVQYEGQVPGASPRGTIQGCAGEVACSSHGVCSNAPTYKCTCSSGWFGVDCSLRQCPFYKAWFDVPSAHQQAHNVAECSNMGICDNTRGECVCQEGFTGGACERKICPKDQGRTCTGHGECLSMGQLAQHASHNGEAVSATYGVKPNDYYRWDFDMMFGCKCDPGYNGVNCATRTCPLGDDPRTRLYHPTLHPTGQVSKVDSFQCTTSNTATGVFHLTFRDRTTTALAWNANAAAVKAALEALFTVGMVEVVYSVGATACTDASTLPAFTAAAATAGVTDNSANKDAVVVVSSNGAGTYTVAVTSGGTGYVNGNTIVILGSKLGGVDTTNDCTLTVTGAGTCAVKALGTNTNCAAAKTSAACTTASTAGGVTGAGNVCEFTAVGNNVLVSAELVVTGAAKAANTVSVTFLTETGGSTFVDLYTRAVSLAPPAMKFVATTAITKVSGAHTPSTREASVCSDRGTCMEILGKCTCLPGYSSSDGTGKNKRGNRGECSFHDKYYVG